MKNFEEKTFIPDENTNWNFISRCQQLSEEFIEKHFDKVNWNYISMYQKLSEEFIEKHSDKINWNFISIYQKLSEEFIEKHSDRVNWISISIHQQLSEEFIEKHSDKINWISTSSNQQLSEKFIEKYSDKVNWFYISKFQKLSEKFIEKNSNKIDWDLISICQKLSEKFIEKHSDKVDWNYISKYQKLSKKFKNKYNLSIPNTCWLYKTKKEKLKYIKKNTDYKVINNQYIIAYKSTKIDGSSIFNFQYQYEVGNTYESHCDCNIDNENSFGLSAWTKEKALAYYNKGKLFEVKININDIGCFVQDDNKIRCWKLTIVEEIRNF